jgi:hypothetical protein
MLRCCGEMTVLIWIKPDSTRSGSFATGLGQRQVLHGRLCAERRELTALGLR